MDQNYQVKLSKALKSGDEKRILAIFELIYNDYVKLVSFNIGKYIDNKEVIKDLTHDCFLKFYQNASNINQSIISYLSAIARNTAFAYLKSLKKEISIDQAEDVSDTFNYQSVIFYQELIADLKKVLSSQEVSIIELHAIEGYSFKEIADILKITASNANVIYFRALKKFKKTIKGG